MHSAVHRLRALVGSLAHLGGARVVNRRYIADHVPFEYRTEASAAFGPSAGAIVSAALGYVVKEDLPKLTAYLSKQFGVDVPK